MVNHYGKPIHKGEFTVRIGENVKAGAGIGNLDKARAIELGVRFLMGVLLGRVRLLGSLSPFGPAVVGAAPVGAGAVMTLMGTILGALTSRPFSQSIKYIAACTLIWATLHFFAKSSPRWFPMAVTFGVTLVLGAVYVWDDGFALRATALWVAESSLAAGAVYFFDIAMSPFSPSAGREQVSAHTASMVIFLGCLIMSLSSVSIFGVMSLGRVAAVVGILMVSFRSGLAPGCVAGAALGAAVDLAHAGPPFFLLSYVLAALIGGIFARSGRLWFVLSWASATALSVLWFWNQVRWIPALYESFAGTVIFMLLPDTVLARVGALLPTDPAGFGFLKAREYALDRVEKCSLAFRGLYDAARSRTGDAPRENVAEIYDRAGDAVCRGCPNSARCWQEQYVDTVEVMNNLTSVLEKRGSVELSDLPRHFAENCQRTERLVAAINAEARTFLTRRQYRWRLRESRGAAFEQYNCVSKILRDLATELDGEVTVETELENKLRKYLRGLAMDSSVAVFRVRGGRLRAEIRSGSLRLLTRDEAWLDKLSVVLGTRLCSTGVRDETRLTLLEAEPLAYLVGSASSKSPGEAVSGDRSLCFRTDEGMLYALLSDGMGTGSDAARISSGVGEILERFLTAGVAPEQALALLSDLMLLRSDEALESATVDLLSIQMFTGEARLYKYGAAPSYLKRGTSVRRLGASPLPAGTAVRRPGMKLSLPAGAMLVMVSDGAISGGDDKWLRLYLASSTETDARKLAADILAESKKRPGDNDDMTVLVVAGEERP